MMTNTTSRASLISILLTALISITLTVVIGYMAGFHPSHSTTVVDEQSGEEKTLWTCGMHPWILEESPGLCPICHMDLTPKRDDGGGATSQEDSKREIAYWRAPMNPMEIYDNPGKSAMGMDLVPVYEDELVSGVVVSIDPVTQQNMGLRTAEVKLGPLIRTIRTYGHVTYDETGIVKISPKISGWLEEIYADFTGKRVDKGAPLFELYSPELISAQEEYLSAYQNKNRLGNKHGKKLVATARRRLEYYQMPEKVIRNIEKTGRIPRTLTVKSPINGVVMNKQVEKGSYFKAGTPIYRLADLSRVWVEVHVYEYELPWVSEGQTAVMTLPYQPGKTYEGKVSFIYPYLQAKTRDVVVRLEFDNPNLVIKPDMYVQVKIINEGSGEGIIIPSEAVIRSGERNVVFVTRGNHKFSPRDVSLGAFLDNRQVQVLTGLAPGETIVTSGQFMLDSESKLKEAVQKMMEVKQPEKQKAAEEDFFDDLENETEDFFSDMEEE